MELIKSKKYALQGKKLIGNYMFLALLGLFVASCSTQVKTSDNADSLSMNDSTTQNNMDTMESTELKPSGEKPAWGPTITPQMQTVIEKLMSYGDEPFVKLSATEARKQHLPADAVMDLIKEHNISVPEPQVDTTGKDIPVSGGKIHMRIYTPKTGNAPFPVIVYYHGGGWVLANLDTYNASAQALAEQVGAVVVSVAYRQAPEYKFPTAHNDSFAAYEWVLNNAGSIKGDPKNVALVGESAGGNLAAAVSLMARDKGIALPKHQVLVYPIAGYNLNTESYLKYSSAVPLNKPLMAWFFEKYLPSSSSGSNPLISLVSANLKGMPSTTIINAQIDPLQTEGADLADKFKAAGVPVTRKLYDGVTHEFFGMAAVLPQAKDAQAFAASELKKALGN